MANPEQPQIYLISPPEIELSRFPDQLARVLDATDLVGGDEPGADGAEGVAAFAFDPLAVLFELEGAFGEVVDDAVARYMLEVTN